MKTIKLIIILLFLSAMANADYLIPWYTIDGGGGTSSGGPYQLTGAVGQPDADYHIGGNYELLGGFWIGGPLCIVDFADFAAFANHWLDSPCNDGNNWCNGADLIPNNEVDINDLAFFASKWLNVCPYDWSLD